MSNYKAGYKVNLDIMSSREVKNVLNEIHRTQFPSDFTAIGCQARAHFVSNRFQANGYRVGKLILSVDDSKKHKFKLRFNQARWDWHITTLISVEQGSKSKLMVVDLSVDKKPISILRYINILTEKELIPNGVSYDVTFCDHNCFIEKNKITPLKSLSNFHKINNKITKDYMEIMKDFFIESRGRKSLDEQERYFRTKLKK